MAISVTVNGHKGNPPYLDQTFSSIHLAGNINFHTLCSLFVFR